MLKTKVFALAVVAATAAPLGSTASAEVKLEGTYIFASSRRCPMNLALAKDGNGFVLNLSSGPTNDMSETIARLVFTLTTATTGRVRGNIREIRGSSHSIAGSGNIPEPLAANSEAINLRYRTTDVALFIEGDRFDAVFGNIDPVTRVAERVIFHRIVDGCIEKGTLHKSIQPPAP